MNGIKHGLIIGVAIGLFFGFVVGRYGGPARTFLTKGKTLRKFSDLPRRYIRPRALKNINWRGLSSQQLVWATKVLNEVKCKCGSRTRSLAYCMRYAKLCKTKKADKNKVQQILALLKRGTHYTRVLARYAPHSLRRARGGKVNLAGIKAKNGSRTSRYKVPVSSKDPSMGPSTALVTIVEFSDFQCGFCRRATRTVNQIKRTYGDLVRVVFKHRPLSFHRQAHLAAQASLAAHEQGKFWKYHDILFRNTRRLQKGNLISYAKLLGLNLKRFKAALNSGKYKKAVDADNRLARSVGANGTPTFFINGVRLVGAQPFSRFKPVIDAELAHAKYLLSKGVSRSSLYSNILKTAKVRKVRRRRAKRFAGARTKVNVGNAPSWGPKNAKVTIVEFSDFQCPFCTRGAKTMAQIKKTYGNKVRIVFKHLPLSFHKQAHLAAQASMAAHAQGKFWPYHDKLFANYRRLSKSAFIKFAKELNLNMAKFNAALNNGTYKKYVNSDKAQARRVGARGTPNFFVNGRKVVGARPFSYFKRIIDQELSGKGPVRYKAPVVRLRRVGNRKQIPVGAAPSWGPKNAKVTIVEFSDFQCPFCTRGARTMTQIKRAYGNKVRIVFKHLPLSFHRQAHAAAQAAMAAHAQGKFWKYHDKLFANYRRLNKSAFLRFAKELGLDMAKFKKALFSGKYKAYVDADKALARRFGVRGTPNFFVNGRKVVGARPFSYFKRIIDEELKNGGAKPAVRAAAKPYVPKIAIGNSPSWGPKNAPVTIFEFSDFECPYCSRGARTIDQIKKAFKGKVRVVFKHLPLYFHKNANLAAQASLAAHAQGKFWQYHDKLFANYRRLSKSAFLRFAKELGLDMAKFKKALDTGKYKQAVLADMALARKVGARGTPTFIINGKKVVGARPFSHFKGVIQAALGAGAAAAKAPSFPVGNTKGAPSWGPKTAKVTIFEYSDFQCPFCARGAKVIKQIKRVYGNKVRVVFKHLPLSFHRQAKPAAQAAMAAHEQGKFWQYHDKLFANYRNLNKANYIKWAKELGLNVAKFTAAINSNKYKAYVEKDAREASRAGANGTPTFIVNGTKVVGAQPFFRFKQVIDKALGLKVKQPKPAKIISELTPTWGPKNAKVTIVEFSDFQCPFCSRGARTIDQIKKNYAGKVRIVFKHLPLSFHRQAHLAAQASMAAHAQGKFWAYHDKLFANYRNLNKANFIKWAKELGLNVAKFKKALDTGKFKAYVDSDLALSRKMGIRGTPNFLINGKKIVGAQPYFRFKAVIDAALSGKKAAPPKKAKLEVGDSPVLGPKTAKVTIYEFSDFQCPFCTRGANTLRKVKSEYGNKVRIVFKHLPLSFHRQAHLAAQASMAAHAQGKFWAYHDKLFANYRNLSKANFIKWAKELGLNVAKFKAALDKGTYKARVDADLALARSVGANGTPTFIINGKKVVGAQPITRFRAVINAALGVKAAAPTKAAPKVVVGGAPTWGPKNAKVTIVEYSDFQCPFCARGAKTIAQVKKVYGNKVRVVFKHLPLGFHKQAKPAAQAAMAAHEQGKFWQYHDKLFANYRNLNKANFIKWAKELGLDVAKFTAAINSNKYKAYVEKDAREASSVGANGTPTFVINGTKVVGAQPFFRFKQVIDKALGLKVKQPKPAKLVSKLTPTWGPKDAKVTIVEFSDFQCPFCSRGARTIDQIKKNYAGKVRIVFKHLPLSFHRQAHLAAQASMAAHEQGKFWEYHDKLFANYRNLNKANFIKWAKELGLDVAKFKKALDTGKFKAYVDADLALSRKMGVRGTPNFLINGTKVVGAQPYARFQVVINKALGIKPPPPKPVVGTSPVWGPKTAKVTILEYSDFQCPFCARGAKVIKQIKRVYGNKVRVVFKHLPLSFHRQAKPAAQAAMAAHEQGKFWAYHDKLFANYRNLNKANFIKWAKELGLNIAQFKKALDTEKYKSFVERDARQASRVGANGTPTFIVNGTKVVGAQPFHRFKAVIDKALGLKAKAPSIKVGNSPSFGSKTAKVTVVEFSDFQCPFCARGAKLAKDIKKKYGTKVRFVFKQFPLGFHKDAHLAAQASLAAHAQGKFWEYHDKLFANQRKLKKADLVRYAQELKLDVAKFSTALNNGTFKAAVDADLATGREVGVRGTPSFYVNGKEWPGRSTTNLYKMIDAALSGKQAAAPIPTLNRRPAPPARVKIAVGGAPTWGPKTAPVTIVEFSDFQCPFCSRGASTISKLKKEYGNKIRVVFKHLPLSFHRQAHAAAQASMAAHAQGKFWAYHDKLFANYRNLNKANFIKFAKELRLDITKFKAALDNKTYKKYVDGDATLAGSVGANGTPTFFINGKKLVGAQPIFRFRTLINAELKKKVIPRRIKPILLKLPKIPVDRHRLHRIKNAPIQKPHKHDGHDHKGHNHKH